jgi:hypothetical protein
MLSLLTETDIRRLAERERAKHVLKTVARLLASFVSFPCTATVRTGKVAGTSGAAPATSQPR